MELVVKSGFKGTDRFKLVRKLGEGGMGQVHEVLDKDSGSRLAAKTLSRLGPLELYLFKNEFRALADIVHPNLVGLHELFADHGSWYFTMDLVRGKPLLDHIWGEGATTARGNTALSPGSQAQTKKGGPEVSGHEATEDLGIATSVEPSAPEVDAPPPEDDDLELELGSFLEHVEEGADASASGWPEDDTLLAAELDASVEVRLRDALLQLARGITALHRAGRLHRDLKPSNVLVDGEGQVLVLDFGLVQDLNRDEDALSAAKLVGTLPYMAPEQIGGQRLGPPADWYAFGVILFEALTGRLPHGEESGTHELIRIKTTLRAPSPTELRANLPVDLVRLCNDLLAMAPEDRPDAVEVLRRLGAPEEETSQGEAPAPVEERFVGREAELNVLRQAHEEVQQGRQLTVYVSGRSGMGKSALVSTFLDGARREGALVLTGRCYEKEAVPFKAIDPIVDELARHLASLSDEERKTRLPPGLGALGQVFEVLKPFCPREAGGQAKEEAETVDLLVRRRRAFEALRALLWRLARATPLVLAIDDLQWSDADSMAALRELLRQPDPPPLLLLLSARSEQLEHQPAAREFLQGEISAVTPPRPLEVGPLSEDESALVALECMGPEAVFDQASRERALQIAREAKGIPIFVEELARHLSFSYDRARRSDWSHGQGARRALAGGKQPTSNNARGFKDEPGDASGEDGQGISLERFIRWRVESLPREARALLEVIAAAGQPLSQAISWEAAGVAKQGWQSIAALCVQHLARTHGRDPGDLIECYHDRVREAVVAGLDEQRLRECHLTLALSMERAGQADPERLLTHFLEAGDLERARRYALTAADNAATALAFDRAADLYGRCLELLPTDATHRHELQIKQATSLINAGRGPEAAQAYLDAAEQVPPEQAWQLKGKAAQALLSCGHLERGKALLKEVLRTMGLSTPGSGAAALASFLGLRARLRLRGLKYQERSEAEIPREDLDQVDACATAAVGIGMADPVEGAAYQTRSLLMALNLGEPRRICLAVALEAAFSAIPGNKGLTRTGQLHHLARALAVRYDDPNLLAAVDASESIAALQIGDWLGCHDAADRARTTLRERRGGGHWELATAETYVLAGLGFLGRLDQALQQFSSILAQAQQVGDLHIETHARLGMEFNAYLIMDQPEQAEADIRGALDKWPIKEGFTLQHAYAQRALAQVALYRGDPEAGLALAEEGFSKLNRSGLRTVVLVLSLNREQRARARLAMAGQSQGRGRARLIKQAVKDATVLDKLGYAWTSSAALLIRAQAALLDGNAASAASLFGQAASMYRAAHMAAHAAVADLRRAELEAPDTTGDAREKMAALGAKNPDALARMVAPVGAAESESK